MGNDGRYSYEFLQSGNDAAFEGFYAIYIEAIPESERKSRQQLAALVVRPDYRLLLLKRGAEVLGFTLAFIAADAGLWLLEYMAMARAQRSQGLGGALFHHACEDVETHYGPLVGLLEVDSVNEASADLATRQRRQAFYRRQGCRRLEGLSYILPLDGPPPPQMELMLYSTAPLDWVSRGQLQQWLMVLYTRVYDCPADDPRIAAMLRSLTDPVKLK